MNTAFVKTALFSSAMLAAGSMYADNAVFVSADPASGSELTSMFKVDTYWDNAGTCGISGFLEIQLRDAATKEVVAPGWMDIDWDDPEARHYPVYLFAEFSKPGSYELVIPAGMFYDDNDNPVSDEVVLNYTITGNGGGGEEEDPGNYPVTFNYADPADGSTVTSLASFKTYWNVGSYLPAGIKDAQLKNAAGEVVATSFIEFDWNDETLFTFGFQGDFAGGEYTVYIPGGALGDDNGNGISEPVTLKYFYEAAATPLYHTSMYPKDGATINYNNGQDLTRFNVSYGANIALAQPGTKVTMTDDKGNTYESDELIAMNLAGDHTLIIPFDTNPPVYSGTYTLIIPEGTVVSGSSRSVEVKGTWNYIQDRNLPNGDIKENNDPLVFTTFNVTDDEGNVLVDFLQPDLKLEKFLSGNLNVGFEREECEAMVFELNDLTTGETIFNIWTYVDEAEGMYSIGLRDENGVFHFALSAAREYDLLKDHKYEAHVHAYYRYDGIAPDLRISKGEGSIKFDGASDAYAYSDVEILSVTPAPGSELDLTNRTITVTYSAPVEIFLGEAPLGGGSLGTIKLTGLNDGMAGVSNFEIIESNKSKTRWSFTISKEYLRTVTEALNPIIAANDMNGLRVRPADEEKLNAFGIYNNGQKELATQSMGYAAYLANPEVFVTPDEGKVESLYAFEFTCPDADHESINFNGGVDGDGNVMTATLRDANGVIVGTLDSKDYDVVYNVPDPDAPGVTDVAIIKVIMHIEKPVTEPGLYILDVPSAYFMTGTQYSSHPNMHIQLEYAIGDLPLEFNAISLKEGGNYNDLGTVTAYAGTEVVVAPGANVEVYLAGSRRFLVASAPLQVAKSGSTYRVYADFCNAANGYAPFQLEAEDVNAGQDYDVVIPEGTVLTATGKSFAEKVVTIHTPGAAEVAVETASLTTEFPNYAVSVNNVVKGKPVKVTLEPAEGWMVQSALLNGEDVTGNIVSNVLELPSIEDAANLQVNFCFNGDVQIITDYTGVTEINGTSYSVRMDNNLVVIDGLAGGELIQVCTLNGAIITSENATGSSVALSLEHGVYVVTINGRNAVKIAL